MFLSTIPAIANYHLNIATTGKQCQMTMSMTIALKKTALYRVSSAIFNAIGGSSLSFFLPRSLVKSSSRTTRLRIVMWKYQSYLLYEFHAVLSALAKNFKTDQYNTIVVICRRYHC